MKVRDSRSSKIRRDSLFRGNSLYETFDVLFYMVGFEKFFSLCDIRFIINAYLMLCIGSCTITCNISDLSILDFLFVTIDDEIDDIE